MKSKTTKGCACQRAQPFYFIYFTRKVGVTSDR